MAYMGKSGKKSETAIWISRKTKEALREIGKKGETYDDLLRRLIREAGYEKVLKNLGGGSVGLTVL